MSEESNFSEKRAYLAKHIEKAINDQKHEIRVYYTSLKMSMPEHVRNMRICDYINQVKLQPDTSEETEMLLEKRAEFERHGAKLKAIILQTIEQQKHHIKKYYTDVKARMDPGVRDMKVRDYLEKSNYDDKC